jgi:hypothetical protein
LEHSLRLIQGERLSQVEQEQHADPNGPAQFVEGLDRALHDTECRPVLSAQPALGHDEGSADHLRQAMPPAVVPQGLLDKHRALAKAPLQRQCPSSDTTENDPGAVHERLCSHVQIVATECDACLAFAHRFGQVLSEVRHRAAGPVRHDPHLEIPGALGFGERLARQRGATGLPRILNLNPA